MEKETKTTIANTSLEQAEGNVAEQSQVDSSRRRFARSVAGSGVILSLASKPVMGSSYWCTGSGGMSGNTSSHGNKTPCLACSPGYWKTSPGTWPTPYYPYSVCNCTGSVLHAATKFSDVFSGGPYPSSTMMWVLQNASGSREFHAISALLNAAKAAATGLTSAYTVYEVQQMYASGAPASTFSSTWEGSMHSCTLSNDNGSFYLSENLPFCNIINANGTDSGKPNKC